MLLVAGKGEAPRGWCSRQTGPTTDPERSTDGSGRPLLARTGNLLANVWGLIGPGPLGVQLSCMALRFRGPPIFPQAAPKTCLMTDARLKMTRGTNDSRNESVEGKTNKPENGNRKQWSMGLSATTSGYCNVLRSTHRVYIEKVLVTVGVAAPSCTLACQRDLGNFKGPGIGALTPHLLRGPVTSHNGARRSTFSRPTNQLRPTKIVRIPALTRYRKKIRFQSEQREKIAGGQFQEQWPKRPLRESTPVSARHVISVTPAVRDCAAVAQRTLPCKCFPK